MIAGYGGQTSAGLKFQINPGCYIAFVTLANKLSLSDLVTFWRQAAAAKEEEAVREVLPLELDHTRVVLVEVGKEK